MFEWKNEINQMGQTLSKPKLQNTNSKTIRKTQDKRTENNERNIRFRFPRNHLG
jgi:hypothetical protein